MVIKKLINETKFIHRECKKRHWFDIQMNNKVPNQFIFAYQWLNLSYFMGMLTFLLVLFLQKGNEAQVLVQFQLYINSNAFQFNYKHSEMNRRKIKHVNIWDNRICVLRQNNCILSFFDRHCSKPTFLTLVTYIFWVFIESMIGVKQFIFNDEA